MSVLDVRAERIGNVDMTVAIKNSLLLRKEEVVGSSLNMSATIFYSGSGTLVAYLKTLTSVKVCLGNQKYFLK